MSATGSKLEVRIEPLADVGTVVVKVEKDSDPNYFTFNSTARDTKTLELESDIWEGKNIFTFTEIDSADYPRITNRFYIKLKNPNKFSIPNMDVLPQDLRDRLHIPLRFSHKIRQVFEKQAPRNEFRQNKKLTAARTPDIYFVFIDILRDDYVKYAPHVQKFLANNVSVPFSVSSATVTWYSSFSMFNALPPFFTYKFISSLKNDPFEHGGFPVRILNQLGYKLDVFGFTWTCVDNVPEGSTLWPGFLQPYLGMNSEFLDICNRPNKDQALVPKFQANWDDTVVNSAISAMGTLLKSSNYPRLFMIYLHNVHEKYKWRNIKPTELASPSESAKTPEELAGDLTDFTKLRNSYINSVKFADKNIKNLLDFIDRTERGRKSIVLNGRPW